MKREREFTSIYTAAGEPEAYIVKGRLECAGIPVMLRYESAGVIYGLTVDGLGQMEILVPSDLAEDAKKLLEENPPIILSSE